MLKLISDEKKSNGYTHLFKPTFLTGGLSRQGIKAIEGKMQLKSDTLIINNVQFPLNTTQVQQILALNEVLPDQHYKIYYFRGSSIILSVEPTSMDKSYWFER